MRSMNSTRRPAPTIPPPEIQFQAAFLYRCSPINQFCEAARTRQKVRKHMEFFGSAIETLKVLVIALGAGLGVWGVINLLEGYGNDNPGANAHVR